MCADEDDEMNRASSDNESDVALQRPSEQRLLRESVASVRSLSRSPKANASSSPALPKKAVEERAQTPSTTNGGNRAKKEEPEQSRHVSGNWKSTVHARPG